MKHERRSALDYPETAAILSVLTGSLQALEELLGQCRKVKDPALVTLAVSESENVARSAVQLSSSLSSFAAENPRLAHANLPPAPADSELTALKDRLLDVLSPLKAHIEEQTISRHVDALKAGTHAEDDYQRSREFVRTPLAGERISVANFLTILSRYRQLTPAESADLHSLQETT